MTYREQIDEFVKNNSEAMRNDTVAFTKIKSVSVPRVPEGALYGEGCKKVLDKALELSEALGFETENHEYHCGSALLRGETDEEIGIMVHLDVVPEGDEKFWSYPPYESFIKDGYIHGRGSCDNKSSAMASLYTLKGLKDLGIKLKHTIRLIYGCSEEAGMEDLGYYLKHTKRQSFPLQ